MILGKDAKRILGALGVGRGRLLEVMQWATENPDSGAMMCRAAAGFALHRVAVLSARKRGWRLKHRINRWTSAEKQLRKLAASFQALGNSQAKP